jgi:DNA-binding transcriptional regulator YiaG
MAQSDDIERMARILVRMHQRGGEAAFLRQASGHPVSYIAKLCGATPEQVYAWERGTLQPSTAQALAWLDALHAAPVPAEQLGKIKQAAADGRG